MGDVDNLHRCDLCKWLKIRVFEGFFEERNFTLRSSSFCDII